MKKSLLISLFFVCSLVSAEPFAYLPNKGGGKIVLTNEKCTANGKDYAGLYRVYNFGSSGSSNEGCYYIDQAVDTVVVVWVGSNDTYRYPVENFTLIKKEKSNGRSVL